MLSFQEYLEEKLITVDNKVYPKFGHIVVMSGGAASGKGFIINKLLGLEGMVFDVDQLKALVMSSTILVNKIKEKTGVDISKISLKDPKNTGLIHEIISDIFRIDARFRDKRFRSIATASKERLPNLIFDITGANIKKFSDIQKMALEMGYDNNNIHIVWVLDDVQAAIKKNKERSRTVPEDILLQTHEGASLNSKKLLSMGGDIAKYMNGDYWIVFNKMKIDSTLVKSDSGGMYVKDANYFKLKSAGKPLLSPMEIDKSILDKIKQYVPKISDWS